MQLEVHRPRGVRLSGQGLIHRAQHEGRRNGGSGPGRFWLIDGARTEDPRLIDGLVGPGLSMSSAACRQRG